MANSRKSKSSLVERVADTLHLQAPQGCSISLGLSGGMDSVVLLHLLHELAPRFSWTISALHVHHGISRNADEWAAFCTKLCAKYSVPLHIKHVDIAPLREELGIEAAARKLRHAAFASQPTDFIALAHHADDQVETLLLQMLRGAGVKGVAAMASFKPAATHNPATLRPLLDIPRSVLLAYARQHELLWVEDESNADDHYPRNFLRHCLLPRLEEKFPAYRDTLSRSARHFAEASGLLDELAREDAQGYVSADALDIEKLRALSPPRSRNLLRYFLHVCGAPMPSTALIEEMLHQLLAARESAAVCITFGAWQVRHYQNKIYVLPALGDFDRNFTSSWKGENELEWPALNAKLFFSSIPGQGISLEKLKRAATTLRLRSGGEKLRPHPAAATRSLKNILQESQIPPWQRERLPLLFCGDELVCVVGVAIAAAYRAEPGEAGISVSVCT